MHTVCDIRDKNLRAEMPPRQLWRSYASDLRALMTRSIQSLESSNTLSEDVRR